MRFIRLSQIQFVSNEKVAELFEGARLLVLPYIEATQSGPIHIAYAFKKPVIATNVDATPDVVEQGNTGIIVQPKDEIALADAIIKLLKNNNLREDMGESAYKKMKNEMPWDMIAIDTIRVYEDVIQSNKLRV